MVPKLQKFLILFDNPSLLYFPGQFLTGRVLLELEAETPFTGLYFHVVGEGVVKGKGQQRLYEKEHYIDFRMRLLGEPGGAAHLLSPGIHSFPFKLGLPLGLPSTFLGKGGFVQFFCKAALREPNGLIHKNQQVFILMNPIDLNQEPAAVAQPFHCEVEHKLGNKLNACMSSGTVFIRIRLDKGGYVPGEKIHIWAAIDNQSPTPLRSSHATLTETIQYSAKGKVVQTERRQLSTFSRGKIKPRSKDEWVNEKLLVPPLPPTNLRGSHLIRIQYDLMFVVVPKLPEKKIKVQIPILIATYPLRDTSNSAEDGHSRGGGVKVTTNGNKEKFPTILPTYRPTTETKPINNNIH